MTTPPKLRTTSLGKHGPQVTNIGFGAMGLSFAYGTKQSDEGRLAFLDELYASGERFWDTADVYADNEDLLGKQDIRDDFVSPSLSDGTPRKVVQGQS